MDLDCETVEFVNWALTLLCVGLAIGWLAWALPRPVPPKPPPLPPAPPPTPPPVPGPLTPAIEAKIGALQGCIDSGQARAPAAIIQILGTDIVGTTREYDAKVAKFAEAYARYAEALKGKK